MAREGSRTRIYAANDSMTGVTTGAPPPPTVAAQVFQINLHGSEGPIPSMDGSAMQAQARQSGMRRGSENTVTLIKAGIQPGLCHHFNSLVPVAGVDTAKEQCERNNSSLENVSNCTDNGVDELTSYTVNCRARS